MKRIDDYRKTCWYNFRHWMYQPESEDWYNSYYNTLGLPGAFWDMTEDEFNILRNGPTFQSINDNDKVLVTKNTKFPKLFIGESGVSLSRTTSVKKADKIVVPDHAVKVFEEIVNHSEKVYAIRCIDNEWAYVSCSHLDEMGKTIDDLSDYLNSKWPGRYEKPILCYFIPRAFEEEYIHTDKLVLFSEFFKYLNSKMIPVTEEMRQNIIGMLKSNDELQMKLAIDMLKTVDLSGILFDLFWVLNFNNNNWRSRGVFKVLPSSIKNSINFKYLMSCMGCNGIEMNQSWYETKRRIILDMGKRGVLNDEQKFRARVGLQKLFYRRFEGDVGEEVKEEIVNAGFPAEMDDTDGKAAACYQELES